MNHIYKTIWNGSLCQWVAASELTSSHSKNGNHKTIKKTAFTLACIFTPLSFALATTAVDTGGASLSTCSLNGSGTVECNGAGNTIKNGIIIQSGEASDPTKPHSVIVENVTITGTNSNGTLSGSGIVNPQFINWPSMIGLAGNNGTANSPGQNYGSLSLTVSNTVYVEKTDIDGTYSGFSGLYSRSDSANSTVSIRSGATIELERNTAGSRTEGILAEAFHSSSQAHLALTDGSNIHVTSNNVGTGSGAKVIGAGSAILVAEENTSIVTSGNNITGMYVSSGGGGASGAVIVEHAGSIVTSGTNAHGIHALVGASAVPTNGTVRIENTGTILAQGNNAHGININNSGSGAILVVNRNDVTATGVTQGGIFGTGTGTGIYASNGSGVNTGAGNSVVYDLNSSNIKAANMGILAEGTSSFVQSYSAIDVNYVGGGTIETRGIDSRATSNSVGEGSASVLYEGAGITVNSNGGSALGIRATNAVLTNAANTSNTGVNASGDIHVSLSNGANANFAYGIEAITYNAGDASVWYRSGTINVEKTAGANANYGRGIVAWSSQANSTGSGIVITDAGTEVHVRGDNFYGIHVASRGTAAGNKVVSANINSVISTQGQNGYGIYAQAVQDAKVDIISQGNISTDGLNAHGINATSVNGEIDVTNTSAITTLQNGSHGINAQQTAAGAANRDILIGNSGNINVSGENSNAVMARSIDGHITVTQIGTLSSTNGRGIHATTQSGDVNVTVNGDITTARATSTVHNHGIDASSNGGKTTVNYDHGTIRVSGTAAGGNTIGIASWDGGSGLTTNESYIQLGSNAIIDATEGRGGLQIRTSGIGEVYLAPGAQVHGGNSYGIQFYSNPGTGANAAYTLHNEGEIDAISDQAIVIGNSDLGSTMTINNYGTITGYLTLSNGDTVFTNYSSNSLNLRNFFDSDSDGIRDTKGIAINDFGAGNDTFNNTTTGTLRLSPVWDDNAIDPVTLAQEYVPQGASSITNKGTIHAQLINLETFINEGLIDLSANGQAGDVLIITQAANTGPGFTGGTGTYIANGGTVKLDTRMNAGGSNSLSDILVLDNASLGSAPTQIQITPTADSTGGLTLGDGIKVIEVKGTLAPNTFVASQVPILYGAYEYYLMNGTGANANNLYLRNNINAGNTIFYNVHSGTSLANQYAAATMFNQNILDRRTTTSIYRNPSDHNRALWVRANYNDLKTDLLSGQHRADIDTTVIQIGSDLYHNENVVAGLYAGYGRSSIDNKSNLSGYKSSGRVNGYHIGAYASLLSQDNTGLYADVWGIYGWYDNKISGVGLLNDSKYDSKGFSLSAEAGYGFKLHEQQNNTTWYIEPHAQIIYTNIDADSFYDTNLAYHHGNKASGVQTRLGARLYGELAQNRAGVTPFVEVNWLYNNVDNKIDINHDRLSSTIGENVGEVKIGLQGNMTDRLHVWGHFGGQSGSDGFKRAEVQLGLGFEW